MNDVTIGTTADLLNDIEQLKLELHDAKTNVAYLERRLAETTGVSVEPLVCRSVSQYPVMAPDELVLPRHPRPGKIWMHFGPLPFDWSSQRYDIVLWHPAAQEAPEQQAEVADQCLRLAVTHGLNVGLVSYSEHLFDRFRVRASESLECLQYIEVQYHTRRYDGEPETHVLNLDPADASSWPRGFGLQGVEAELTIGENQAARSKRHE